LSIVDAGKIYLMADAFNLFNSAILNPGDDWESIEEMFFLSTENKLEEEYGMIVWIFLIDSCDK